MQSTFCETHVLPRANLFGLLLIFYFLFQIDRFTLSHTVYFYDAAFEFQAHCFHFCNTCLFLKFQNSSGVTRHNIFYYAAVWPQSPLATSSKGFPFDFFFCKERLRLSPEIWTCRSFVWRLGSIVNRVNSFVFGVRNNVVKREKLPQNLHRYGDKIEFLQRTIFCW